MVLVDSDIILEFLQGKQPSASEIAELCRAQAGMITPIQVAELEATAKTDEQLGLIREALALFDIAEVTHTEAKQAAAFMRQYGHHYEKLSLADCLVAAVAVANDCEVYTNKPQHFPMTEVQLYHKTIEAITAKSTPRLANH